MIATFFKKKWSKLIIALVAIFGLFSFLFHNDRFYSVSEEKIGPLFKDYFGVSIFHASNYFANFLDVKGKVKALSNPLTEDDFINITIGPEGLAKLEKGLLSVPRKNKKVAATLTLDGIPQLCRLKFHGTSDNHYQDNKYSYSIKIKK